VTAAAISIIAYISINRKASARQRIKIGVKEAKRNLHRGGGGVIKSTASK